ncbi:hypothetical protein AC369_04330 [Salmonella enterica subsp. diarizonae]|nr:hypothetical protein [Salmonella enterica]EBF4781844.1 hypothetical protein [Salmonella enterica subsp. diarizonae]EGF0273757.1 hypothetical protein [Salmonella enterica]EHP6628858.1 hypothetical protein [Salmonella enterica]EJR9172448.1 hypothetical protein [Salmonella enterica]
MPLLDTGYNFKYCRISADKSAEIAQPFFIRPGQIFIFLEKLRGFMLPVSASQSAIAPISMSEGRPLSDRLSIENLQWLKGAVLKPAEMAMGPCVLTSAGIFTYLNGGGKEKADVFFEQVRYNGMTGKDCSMEFIDIFSSLIDTGIPLKVDIYFSNTHIRDREGCTHGRLAEKLGHIAQEHPFDIDLVRYKLNSLSAGQCLILTIDNAHVISVARDAENLWLFDTNLNPHKNCYEQKYREIIIETQREIAPYLFTPSGEKYACNEEAQCILDNYLSRVIKRQPVIISVDSQ